MKRETSLLDVFDNEKMVKYLNEARKGNKQKQKDLFIALKGSVKSIGYSFYGAAIRAGISITDVDDLVSQAFLICFNKYDENIGSLLYYYKLIYTNLIRDLIKKNYCSTKIMENSAKGDEKDAFEVEIFSENNKNEIKDNINNSEILHYVLKEENCPQLTDEERYVIYKYSNSFSFKEISEELQVKYNTVISRFRNGINKLRRKFKIIGSEINEDYLLNQLTK